ncbi:UNVERIFIED_CONTAM: hypothetical protein K2H54_001435 [Gekko kuhli]
MASADSDYRVARAPQASVPVKRGKGKRLLAPRRGYPRCHLRDGPTDPRTIDHSKLARRETRKSSRQCPNMEPGAPNSMSSGRKRNISRELDRDKMTVEVEFDVGKWCGVLKERTASGCTV